MLNKKRINNDSRFSESRKPPIPNNSEKHIPGYNFCGPGTQVSERLKRGDLGVNELDNACRVHDVEYMIHAGDKNGIMQSDQKLINSANSIKEKIFKLREEISRKGLISKIAGFIGDRVLSLFGGKNGNLKVGSEFLMSGLDFKSDAGVILASKIVANLFKGKKFLESIKIIDPISWAKSLNGNKSDYEIQQEGKELFKKYF